jgi:hypothetical protein
MLFQTMAIRASIRREKHLEAMAQIGQPKPGRPRSIRGRALPFANEELADRAPKQKAGVMDGCMEAEILEALERGEDIVQIAIRHRLHLAQVQGVRRQVAEVRGSIWLLADQVRQIEKIAWRAGPEQLRTAEDLVVAMVEAQAPEQCSRCRRKGLPCLCADCMKRAVPASPPVSPPRPAATPPAPPSPNGSVRSAKPPPSSSEITPAMKAAVAAKFNLPPLPPGGK